MRSHMPRKAFLLLIAMACAFAVSGCDAAKEALETGANLVETATTTAKVWASMGDTGVSFLEINKLAVARYSTDSKGLKKQKKATAMIQSKNKAIKKKAKKIIANAGATTDQEKYQALYDWVAGTIYYDWPDAAAGAQKEQDALSVLERGTAVCEGYANLYASLCRAVGLPCRFVGGFAYMPGLTTDEEFAAFTKANDQFLEGGDEKSFRNQLPSQADYSGHAWNAIWVDGGWVMVDPTWGSGNRVEENGKQKKGRVTQEYFAPTLESFSTNHCIID